MSGVQVAATPPRVLADQPGEDPQAVAGLASDAAREAGGEGCETSPAYDASASLASSAATGRTVAAHAGATRASATRVDWSLASTVTPSAAVTPSGTSSGGGSSSETSTVGQGSVWSRGDPSMSSASAPDVQPPLPELGGPQNRWATTSVSYLVLPPCSLGLTLPLSGRWVRMAR